MRACKSDRLQNPTGQKKITHQSCTSLRCSSAIPPVTRYKHDVEVGQLVSFHTHKLVIGVQLTLSERAAFKQETIYCWKMFGRVAVKFRLLFLSLFPAQVLQFSVTQTEFYFFFLQDVHSCSGFFQGTENSSSELLPKHNFLDEIRTVCNLLDFLQKEQVLTKLLTVMCFTSLPSTAGGMF